MYLICPILAIHKDMHPKKREKERFKGSQPSAAPVGGTGKIKTSETTTLNMSKRVIVGDGDEDDMINEAFARRNWGG